MMKPMKLRWCLFPMACLLVVAATGCEKEPPPPAKPKVVVKKIAVAPKASKAPAKPAPANAKATKPAPAPAKETTVQPAPAQKPETTPQAPPAKGAAPAAKEPSAIKEKAPEAAPPATVASPETNATQTSPADAAAGSPAAGVEKQKASGLSELVALNRPRIYDPEGRINPFTPLFEKKPEAEEKEKDEAKQRKRKVRVPQTPLEKVDLAQLKLVAIMHMQSGPRALVEESSGKGYVVHKGTYMGLHSGQVVEITGDRVIVEEEVENLLGNFEIKTRELKLQKPLGD